MSSRASGGASQPDEADAAGASTRSVIGRAAERLLIVLALVLPFEVPLFRLGPLQITTVELALYAMLGAWGADLAIDGLRGRTPWRAAPALLRRDGMARAAALWAAVLFASAVTAPTDRAAALKFALRSLSGILAFFAARSLARSREVRRWALIALVAGGLVSAATACVDSLVPASAPAWRFFHEGSFDAAGLKRASGVFEYPTIGAMYWEASVPLFIAAPFAWRRREDATLRRAARLAVLGSAVLFSAILASATRTALVGAALVCALLAAVGRRSEPLVGRVAAGSLGVLVVLSAIAFRPGGSGSPVAQRLRWWHDGGWFGARYEVPAGPLSVPCCQSFRVPITLQNTGAIAWRHAGALPTRLSYHWALELAGGPRRLVEFEGRRTDLPEDVPPGGVVHLVGEVQAPTVGGSYRLSWDLVQENVTWFSERGNAVAEQAVTVGGPESSPLPEVAAPRVSPPPAPRSRLWRAAVDLWRESPLLGVGPDNFRRRYEALLPPSPTGAPYTDTRIHANSLYFETLADLGLAGVAALVVLALALLRSLRKHWEAGCVLGLGCAVAAVAFFVHGLLDYFFEFTPLYGLFWVTLGLTAAFEPMPAASPARQGMPR